MDRLHLPTLALAALAVFLGGVFLGSRGCKPAVEPYHVIPMPYPSATPEVKASAAAKTRVVIERPIFNGNAGNLNMTSPGGAIPRDPEIREQAGPPMERIIIETETTAVATAPIITPVAIATPTGEIDHTRIGIVTGTVPGFAAVSFQAVRGKPLKLLSGLEVLPKDLLELEMSADLEANHRQAGVMASVGGKVYGGVGYYASWSDLKAEPFAAVGMRF